MSKIVDPAQPIKLTRRLLPKSNAIPAINRRNRVSSDCDRPLEPETRPGQSHAGQVVVVLWIRGLDVASCQSTVH